MRGVLRVCLRLLIGTWWIPDAQACDESMPLARSEARERICTATAALRSGQPKQDLELLRPEPGKEGMFQVDDTVLQTRMERLWAETHATEEAIARCIELVGDPGRCSAEPIPPARRTRRWKHRDCDGL